MNTDKLLRKQVRSEKKKRRYVLYTFLFLSLIYLFTALLMGDRGLMRYLELQEKQTTLDAQIEALRADNERLRQAIQSYRGNDFFLEKHARENFGLSGKDEFIYLYEK